MVGLGETPEEVEELMDDLRRVGCHILTIGQYLQPTHKHYPVAAYITPKQFALYREKGLEKRVSASGKRSIGTLLLSCGKTDPFYTKKK